MDNINRRKFLSLLSVSTAIPTLTIITQRTALAADLPLVDANSGQAIALQYLPISKTAGQSCSTCALFQGNTDAKLGTCPLFKGSSVSADAVCVAWAAKS
jgi:hypothetical protein